jgi:enoyl-CoA hydratase
MNYNILKVDKNEGIVIVTISRPNSMNALNSAFFDEMNLFLDQLTNDVKIMIITGDGKAFVAGADIAEMIDKKMQEALDFSIYGQKTFERLGNLDIPVIAAVNGFALGGGCELALACDFRIASKSAKFSQPEVTLGLIPGYSATQRLSRLVGLGNALFMLLTTEMITAEDALRIGLVQKIVEPDELMNVTVDLAKKILTKGPKAVKKVKLVTRQGYQMSFEQGCTLESEEFALLFESDGIEGMKAFLEKRKPVW